MLFVIVFVTLPICSTFALYSLCTMSLMQVLNFLLKRLVCLSSAIESFSFTLIDELGVHFSLYRSNAVVAGGGALRNPTCNALVVNVIGVDLASVLFKLPLFAVHDD